VKIRRQGNSLAVTLDQETLDAARLREGDLVVPTVKAGVVVLTAVELRPRVLDAGTTCHFGESPRPGSPAEGMTSDSG